MNGGAVEDKHSLLLTMCRQTCNDAKITLGKAQMNNNGIFLILT
jgi:hypothetical protein